MKSQIPSPKSDLSLCVRGSRLEIQNPQIRSPRWEQREQSLTQIQNPQIRSPKWSLRGKSESSQSEITKSLVQPGPGEKNSSRANPKSPNPKSDGALGEERAISETERVPVMSLIKSYRTSLLNPTGVQDSPSLPAAAGAGCAMASRASRRGSRSARAGPATRS